MSSSITTKLTNIFYLFCTNKIILNVGRCNVNLSLKNTDIPYPVNRIIVINRINVTIFIYIIN